MILLNNLSMFDYFEICPGDNCVLQVLHVLQVHLVPWVFGVLGVLRVLGVHGSVDPQHHSCSGPSAALQCGDKESLLFHLQHLGNDQREHHTWRENNWQWYFVLRLYLTFPDSPKCWSCLHGGPLCAPPSLSRNCIPYRLLKQSQILWGCGIM